MPVRVLVVDDTAIYRKVVTEALREIDGVEVIGTAINGQLALEKIAELQPDLVTLDLEMPLLSGVDVLKQLRKIASPVGVLMLSAFTSAGAAATTEALRLGAFDFVLKPATDNFVESSSQLSKRLADRVAAFAQSRNLGLTSIRTPVAEAPKSRASRIVASNLTDHPEVIVLGISTGGPEALNKVIPRLPADLSAPLFIVQHMPPLFTKSLADDLNTRSKLRVSEAIDGQLAQPGDCLVAPGGKQMKIERTEHGPLVHITDDPPENSCRPAVDYLFRSAAHHYGARVLAVIMTGMGSDGTLGCRLLKRHGAPVLAQDKESCVVFGMPSMVIAEGLADCIIPLEQMAGEITAIAHAGSASLAGKGACA
ncbi:chemotaxis response regulator protein-glutamate methylesterase [Anatilimnocola sp. NA78]|uniref:protein-glutamate methylesterase/protein-glutamine glutaminase n=1 Tax=Anatilimnocola sp. NA78 TaxID=3415683 RepID=UPI003CE58046